MKRIICRLAAGLLLTLLCTLCACGKAPSSRPGYAVGNYTLFAIQNEEFTVDSDEEETFSTLTLNTDGTGLLVLEGRSRKIVSWSLDGIVLSLKLEDGTVPDAILQDSVLELDMEGTGVTILYYGQDGADSSGNGIRVQPAYEPSPAA